MVDHVDPAAALVFVVDLEPTRLGDVGVHEHRVFRARVVLPLRDREHVVGGELPPPHRVFVARAEALFLLDVGHAEPVLQQDDALFDQHPFEDRRLVQKAVILRVRAVPHHVLDAGAVVPGAVHQHDLTGGRQVRDVALEVPLRLLALGRGRQRDGARDAGVEELRDTADGRALAGGIATLEDHHDPRPGRLHPGLHVDQLRLQRLQLAFVQLLRHALAHLPTVARRVPNACSAGREFTPTGA